MLIGDDFPELGTDLVAALASELSLRTPFVRRRFGVGGCVSEVVSGRMETLEHCCCAIKHHVANEA